MSPTTILPPSRKLPTRMRRNVIFPLSRLSCQLGGGGGRGSGLSEGGVAHDGRREQPVNKRENDNNPVDKAVINVKKNKAANQPIPLPKHLQRIRRPHRTPNKLLEIPIRNIIDNNRY